MGVATESCLHLHHHRLLLHHQVAQRHQRHQRHQRAAHRHHHPVVLLLLPVVLLLLPGPDILSKVATLSKVAIRSKVAILRSRAATHSSMALPVATRSKDTAHHRLAVATLAGSTGCRERWTATSSGCGCSRWASMARRTRRTRRARRTRKEVTATPHSRA